MSTYDNEQPLIDKDTIRILHGPGYEPPEPMEFVGLGGPSPRTKVKRHWQMDGSYIEKLHWADWPGTEITNDWQLR
jgi:hypothetical protein